MSTATHEKQAERKKTRLAHLMLPQLDPNSALLPPDKWILSTLRDIVTGNRSFQRTLGGAAAWSLAAAGAVAGGIAAAFLLPAAVAAGAGLLAAAAGFFSVRKARTHLADFKSETLPGLRTEIGRKYLEYKMSELKAAWAKNLEARRQQKAAEKPKTADPAPAAAPTPAPETTPAAEKKDFKSTFGDWAAKIADKRRQKDPAKDANPPKPPAPPQP